MTVLQSTIFYIIFKTILHLILLFIFFPLGLSELPKYPNKSWRLLWSRMYGLLCKRIHYTFRIWRLWIMKLFIPLILMCFCFALLQDHVFTEYLPLDMNTLNIYKYGTFGFVERYSDIENLSDYESVVTNELYTIMQENLIFIYTHPNVTDLVSLYAFINYPVYLSGFLVGGSVAKDKNNSFIAWYNHDHYHTGPIALNFMHTAILRSLTGNGSIYLRNHPLPYIYVTGSENRTYSRKVIIRTIIPILSSFIGASYVFIPAYENVSKVKLLQLMTGMSLKLYWMSMFLWDILIHILLCIFIILPLFLFQPVCTVIESFGKI